MIDLKEEIIKYNREIDPSWRLCRLLNFDFKKINYFKKCKKRLTLIKSLFDIYLVLSSAILIIAYFKTFNWFYEMFSFNEIINQIRNAGFIFYIVLVIVRYQDFEKKNKIVKINLKIKRCKAILEYFEMYYNADYFNDFKEHVDISKMRNKRKINFTTLVEYLKL